MTEPTENDEAGFDVVAELQRQQTILEKAREKARAQGKYTPSSGSLHYEDWAVRTLAAAGETYIIRRGRKVPIDSSARNHGSAPAPTRS